MPNFDTGRFGGGLYSGGNFDNDRFGGTMGSTTNPSLNDSIRGYNGLSPQQRADLARGLSGYANSVGANEAASLAQALGFGTNPASLAGSVFSTAGDIVNDVMAAATGFTPTQTEDTQLDPFSIAVDDNVAPPSFLTSYAPTATAGSTYGGNSRSSPGAGFANDRAARNLGAYNASLNADHVGTRNSLLNAALNPQQMTTQSPLSSLLSAVSRGFGRDNTGGPAGGTGGLLGGLFGGSRSADGLGGAGPGGRGAAGTGGSSRGGPSGNSGSRGGNKGEQGSRR